MGIRWQKLQIAEPRHDFVHAQVYRASVPGGWLVAVFWSAGHIGGPAVTYYPDPDHVWTGEGFDQSSVAVQLASPVA